MQQPQVRHLVTVVELYEHFTIVLKLIYLSIHAIIPTVGGGDCTNKGIKQHT
jgi:hypothetical protein